jgi:glyoxylase-like metal-dependent hydrolase (beta-lactamase superfamily II)
VAKNLDELGRGERVLPGVWRLRLPLPWENSPHGNAYAVSAGDGIVLVDTGYAGEDGTRQLEFALAQVGCLFFNDTAATGTHTHADHYGLAGPILDATGCELWMHPAWAHVRPMVEDPGGTLERRLALARRGGVTESILRIFRAARTEAGTGIARIVEPDRTVGDEDEVETDHGSWRVMETPGHAPSHIVLHQPESGLLISGDHIGGKIFLFFDYGHTPDPVGEYLASLDRVEALDTGLCLPGHGRSYRDVPGKVRVYREEVRTQLGRVREALGDGPKTPYEVIQGFVGGADLEPGTFGYALQMVMSYLDHLTLRGELERDDEGDVHRWVSIGGKASG